MTNWVNAKLNEYRESTKIQWYFIKNGLIREKKIRGLMKRMDKILLHKTAKNLAIQNPIVVEIGSYLGMSSSFIAHAIKAKKGKLYCIDTWFNENVPDYCDIGKNVYQEFLFNTKKYKFMIIALRGKSCEMVDNFKRLEKKIDYLFIDGDHSYQGVKTDWDLYSPFLKPGSIVAFHDKDWPGVKKLIQESVMPRADVIAEGVDLLIFKLKKD